MDRFEPVRRRLLNTRSGRVPPLRDEKCLADWNGLLAAGAARAGRLLDEPRIVRLAASTADALLDLMKTDEGGMMHRLFGGEAGVEGGIDDYAMPALGFVELFEATGEPRWLRAALDTASELIDRFLDEESGTLRISGRTDIPVSQTRLRDEAYPSGSGVALDVLARLYALTDDSLFGTCLSAVFEANFPRLEEWPEGHATALAAASVFFGAVGEIVVTAPAGHVFHGIVRTTYLPDHVRVHVTDETADELAGMLPFLKPLVRGRRVPAVFICTNRTCERPVHDADALREILRTYTGRVR
jgi:uncharacterized protein YyaL (SSP411 family)